MSNPTTDPVAFWTNGGPGCSGLIGKFFIILNFFDSFCFSILKIGFMTEQGPFKPNADLTLKLNDYAWNTVSNMVFIESPAGVGFSYSDNKDDLTTGDAQTSLDNYNLIQAFLTRFPEYRANDLYITSESYGGHYMPTLAQQIVNQNNAGVNPKVNFKGFAVGNPYTNVYSGTPAMIDTYWGHQLIPKPTYDSYVSKCRNSIRPNVKECAQLETEIMDGVGDLNPYALDYPVCTDGSKGSHAQRLWQLNHQLKAAGIMEAKSVGLQSTDAYEPCADNYALSYLNRREVKSALHVKTDLKWAECSYTLKYNYSDSSVSTAPIYNYLIDGGAKLNILVYSGDDDSVCVL
jgi:carboxypeptidase C (cathepsin A)